MTEMGTRWLTTVVILDKGMIHILVGQSRTAWDVIKLLRIAHNLKLRNCSIWKFPFHIFGLQLTADNWNHRKQNLRWGETTVISTRNQIGIFFFSCQTRALFSHPQAASPGHVANLSNLPCSLEAPVSSVNHLPSDSWSLCLDVKPSQCGRKSTWLGIWKFGSGPPSVIQPAGDPVVPTVDLGLLWGKAFLISGERELSIMRDMWRAHAREILEIIATPEEDWPECSPKSSLA